MAAIDNGTLNIFQPRGKLRFPAMKIYLGFGLASLMVLPLIWAAYGYSATEAFLAIILLNLCLYPTARYFAHQESGLPSMALMSLAYAIQFALPVFTRDNTFTLLNEEIKTIDSSETIAALFMAIFGVAALQVGFYWLQSTKYRKLLPVAKLPLRKNRATVYCIVMGLVVPALLTFKAIIPEQYQAPLSSILWLMQNQVLVVIGILGWLLYGRQESKWYAVWLYGIVIMTMVRGISAGSLETALVPLGVLFAVKWVYNHRVPVVTVAAAGLIIIFLSPVKADYRKDVWFSYDPEVANQSAVTKASHWVEQAADYWSGTASGKRDFSEATSSATSRADFIHQIAHIYSMTPSVVPYQYGNTYSFFVVAFIPRILWPNKPNAGSANDFYAINYGITNEEGVKTTTFGVSVLGEAFMNFGWPGIVILMMLQGVIIAVLQNAFGRAESGPGGQAVFLACFVYFLNGIGSSTEIMFGGILQNLMCGYVLLLWARQKNQIRASKRPSLAEITSPEVASR